MQQRQQLTLVFSNSNSSTPTRSRPCKMSLGASSKRSVRRESPFLAKMRRLEVQSPAHAAVLEKLADQVLRVAIIGHAIMAMTL